MIVMPDSPETPEEFVLRTSPPTVRMKLLRLFAEQAERDARRAAFVESFRAEKGRDPTGSVVEGKVGTVSQADHRYVEARYTNRVAAERTRRVLAAREVLRQAAQERELARHAAGEGTGVPEYCIGGSADHQMAGFEGEVRDTEVHRLRVFADQSGTVHRRVIEVGSSESEKKRYRDAQINAKLGVKP